MKMCLYIKKKIFLYGKFSQTLTLMVQCLILLCKVIKSPHTSHHPAALCLQDWFYLLYH